MKNFKRAIMCICLCLVCVIGAFFMAGCAGETVSVVKIEKTDTIGLVDEYTIFYSDGSRDKITVSNGRDGLDGKDGEDAPRYNLEELYEQYRTSSGDEVTYEEFLKKFLNYNVDNSAVVADALNSSLTIYTLYEELTGDIFHYNQSIEEVLYTGSAVIYEMGEQDSYIVTNYHVIYDTKAIGSKICDNQNIHLYLYGSGYPMIDSENNYVFGDYAIDCTLVAGSAINDIAVLKVPSARLKEINPNAHAVTLADGYRVGQKTISIGNSLGMGVSVTEGIVSVDSEYVQLDGVDGTLRDYRSMRIDSAIYNGNSGGGLFDTDGKLIGITNSGLGTEAQNINHAIPIDTVRAVTDAIIDYDKDSYDGTKGLYKITLGITLTSLNARYAYDKQSCSGRLVEDVTVSEIVTDSIASKLGLSVGDQLKKFVIDRGGDIQEFDIVRNYSLTNAIYSLRAGDKIKFVVSRGAGEENSSEYTVLATDFVEVG